jgi:hypothetical protein
VTTSDFHPVQIKANRPQPTDCGPLAGDIISQPVTAHDPTDFDLSLQALEASDWGEPRSGDTWMVKTIHALRRKPLRSLTDEELRLAVNQQVGVPFILDLAFQRLAKEPLLEGSHYPGDILSALIRADPSIWTDRPHLRKELSSLYRRALDAPADVNDTFREFLSLPESDASH